MSRDRKSETKRKREADWLMAQIMAIMEKSLKTALDEAMKEIFDNWK